MATKRWLILALVTSLAACGDNEHAPPAACEPITYAPADGDGACPDDRHIRTVEVRGDTARVVCACPAGAESDRAAPWSRGTEASK